MSIILLEKREIPDTNQQLSQIKSRCSIAYLFVNRISLSKSYKFSTHWSDSLSVLAGLAGLVHRFKGRRCAKGRGQVAESVFD